jgi:CheY-like chemotaxis protein
MLDGSHTFILLAEDDEDDQELIRLAFKRANPGHNLKVVANGREVLDTLVLQSSLPCVIILDLNMPVLNGIQTLAALQEEPRFRKIPKVMLTTSDSEDSRQMSYLNGAIEYFVKPANMSEFVRTAEKILSYCQ